MNSRTTILLCILVILSVLLIFGSKLNSVFFDRKLKLAPKIIVKTTNQARFDNYYMKNEYTCGSDKWAANYAIQHRSSLTDAKNSKFLIYSCRKDCGGLAERMLGIVSTFYVALLTNRIFLIDSTVPVELDTVLEPNRIDWRFKNYENHIRLMDYSQEDMRNLNEEKQSTLLESDFSLKFTSQVQYLKMNQRLFTLMHQNHHFSKRREELGLERMSTFHIFGCLYQYLFKPSPKVDTFIRDFYNFAFLNSIDQRIPVIGLYIDPETVETSQELDKFWNCAERLLNKYPQSRLLLVGDNTSLKESVEKKFNRRAMIFDIPIDNIDKVTSGNSDSFRNAVSELILLSLCDHFIISKSNMGEIATMINFKPRYKIPNDKCDSNLPEKYEYDTYNQV